MPRDKVLRLASLKRFLRHLDSLGQTTPMNLAEQLRHAHRVRRTLAAVVKTEQEPARVWAIRRGLLEKSENSSVVTKLIAECPWTQGEINSLSG